MLVKWSVRFTHAAAKQVRQLPENVLLVLQILVENLSAKGPAPGKCWHHYGKLKGAKQEDKRHCHLTRGRPTYVCCWRVYKQEKLIEVYYVGTHESAPY